MSEIYCPVCEEKCEIDEAQIGYGSDETCEVAVCMNKKCENYDKVVYDVAEYYEGIENE